MKNTKFYPMSHFRFDSSFAIPSAFVFSSSMMISDCEIISDIGQSFSSVISSSLAFTGKVSKRGDGIFVYGDSREKYLSYKNSVDPCSVCFGGLSICCA